MPSTRRADEPRPVMASVPHRRFAPGASDRTAQGTCSAATVARLFSMHRRTLHRHLRMEGLAFRQVANEIRFEIACELLENTDMALSQIAAVLRYSELSAFTRAFRRWSGQTPSAWRSSHPRGRKSRRLRKSDNPHPEQDHGHRSEPLCRDFADPDHGRRALRSGPTDGRRSFPARQSKTVNAMAQRVKQRVGKDHTRLCKQPGRRGMGHEPSRTPLGTSA